MITEQIQPQLRDDGYPNLRLLMRSRLENLVDDSTPLFTTDVEGLFDVFLSNLPEASRQHYRCNCCHHFIERFGGLVSIDEFGTAVPVMWPTSDHVPELFEKAMKALTRHGTAGRKITGVFMSDKLVLGTPQTGAWTHFHAMFPAHWCGHVTSKVKNAHQLMAEKSEDYKTVCQFLGDYDLVTIQEAHRILETGTLPGCEKAMGPARWLLDLQRFRKEQHGRPRDNLTWLAIAKAPAGFCHPRASILGELIDMVKSGSSFEDIRRRMGAMTDPLKYQRAQTLPSAGTIKRAEEIFEKMNLASALKRRFAKLEEIQTIWKPATAKEVGEPAGIFGHLVAKNSAPAKSTVETPSITMTWEKFKRTILEKTTRIQYNVPSAPNNYVALVTAADPTAEPILLWDFSDSRNPVNWYIHNHPVFPAVWNLTPGWRDVTGITTLPCHWRDEKKNAQFSPWAIFLLDGAWDSRADELSLFPNILKSELHEVRSVIENFSKRGKIEGCSKEESTACGAFLASNSGSVVIRAWHDGTWNRYTLDRLD